MAYIFDGKKYASEKLEKLSLQVKDLQEKGVIPKLVSIIVGDDPASILYVNLKKKAAEQIGCVLDVRRENSEIGKKALIELIGSLNKDSSVHGIMIQLPLPKNFSKDDRDEIINEISPEKDIDGLRPESKFTPPTAKAVLEIFWDSREWQQIKEYPGLIAVVGASGFIGRQIIKALENLHENSYRIVGIDSKVKNLESVIKNADVVISVTGVPDLIKADMVKENAVLIDVGSPKGDIEKLAYEKAVFVSPVPGGVGPVTISCLMENLINSVEI